MGKLPPTSRVLDLSSTPPPYGWEAGGTCLRCSETALSGFLGGGGVEKPMESEVSTFLFEGWEPRASERARVIPKDTQEVRTESPARNTGEETNGGSLD